MPGSSAAFSLSQLFCFAFAISAPKLLHSLYRRRCAIGAGLDGVPLRATDRVDEKEEEEN